MFTLLAPEDTCIVLELGMVKSLPAVAVSPLTMSLRVRGAVGVGLGLTDTLWDPTCSFPLALEMGKDAAAVPGAAIRPNGSVSALVYLPLPSV